MELRFDVKDKNFADIKAQADDVVRTFIGQAPYEEVERHYTEMEGTSIDVSGPSGYRLSLVGFYANVRSVIR